MDSDQFKTLLAAASFMGPDEARVESNTGRVRYGTGLIDRIYPLVHTYCGSAFICKSAGQGGCGVKN